MMYFLIIAIVFQITSIDAFENHPRCGRVPSGSSQHTTGREVTTINHPWAVAIMKNQGTELHCSGSIISSRFILSAAHCMKFVDISNLELVLGASNLKDPANSKKGVIKKGIKGYKTHEKNVNGVDYDIAIIEVGEEITFDKRNPRIWPICLPEKSNSNSNHLQFRGIKVVGYGPQDDEELKLNSIDLTIKPIAVCNAKYDVGQENRNYWEIFDSLPTKFNSGSVFCASNTGTDDGTCRGDSGGPALFSDGIKYQQLGVVHGSITSCDGSRFPSIYVRIDNPDVFNWISKVTSSASVSGFELEKEGQDCWGGCNSQQGQCNWCGAGGWCCRMSWTGNGCDGTFGGATNHQCVLKPSGDGNCKQLKVTGNTWGAFTGTYMLSQLKASKSPTYPVYQMVNSTSVWCGRRNAESIYADSCETCPQCNGLCRILTLQESRITRQRCIFDESKRERLLDHYIYHNPGGVGWRTADDKERLSGNTEGGYHYGSYITKKQFWMENVAWGTWISDDYEIKVECIEK